MIIYNITVKADHSIAAGWLSWLKDEYIPAIINTGCFTHATIFHLFEVSDEEGLTYAIQFHAPDESSYNHYSNKFAEQMMKKANDKWGDKIIAFPTVMTAVN